MGLVNRKEWKRYNVRVVVKRCVGGSDGRRLVEGVKETERDGVMSLRTNGANARGLRDIQESD